MADENAVLNEEEISLNKDLDFDFDELEEKLQSELENELSDLEFLKEEEEKIGNPDALGKVIMDEVWNQFGKQIGLDMTNETLTQKYDREHQGETYSEVGKKVMQDPKYKEANKAMKEQQKAGKLKDEYTGKKLGQNDKANLDHVVSRKEVFENKRRRQAGIATEELANKAENLKATNESLNKSKGAKSVDEYNRTKKQREKDLKDQCERANKKIDESNMSDLEKRKAKEKNQKQLKDKLDADPELMAQKDKEARRAINKTIAKGVAKETVKEAGKNAMKQMAVEALFSMLKEVMNGFVRYLKNKEKSLENFLNEMKKAIHTFFGKISGILKTGVSSAVGTIVTEIFEPILGTFKKLASLIKQGISSVMEAVRYLTDKENKNKSFGLKVAEVGKIITAGFVAVGAMSLGDVLEGILLSIPGMQVKLPLMGSLANIIGMFLASLVSGIAGAVIINFIDKFIAKKQESELKDQKIKKANSVLGKQEQIKEVVINRNRKIKTNVVESVSIRHQNAGEIMTKALEKIEEDCDEDYEDIENTKKFNDIDNMLKRLME